MKTFRYLLIFMLSSVLVSCNAQTKTDKVDKIEEKPKIEQPQGTWKVDKEFDENGNLIRYDSIYSWSSGGEFKDLPKIDRDSLLNNFESKFYRHFSQFKNDGFEDIFQPDSSFSNHFFNDDFFKSDFGEDFMDIDKIRQKMFNRQKHFLEKYRKDFEKKRDSL